MIYVPNKEGTQRRTSACAVRRPVESYGAASTYIPCVDEIGHGARSHRWQRVHAGTLKTLKSGAIADRVGGFGFDSGGFERRRFRTVNGK